MTTSTPHYPSTAELAAFRRSINPAWFAAYEHGYRDMSGQIVAANGTMKRHGCPVRNGRDHIPAIARREASALRSRAFPTSLIDPETFEAFAPERGTCCPHYRQEHGRDDAGASCAGCDAAGWPISTIEHGYR